ncbi:hypothetical protein FIBSPDRAFT_926630 [Athelia psychrophila]|uniref:Uncharacterized protein n=1 Tax=Athelia psychrophila TaxID=1759441 RepID=A0A166T2X2_9AGAM|nr:hypothetical protein FIBSPDRAFT_926630 [Fibularhizoctonia sp. CBS 109695]
MDHSASLSQLVSLSLSTLLCDMTQRPNFKWTVDLTSLPTFQWNVSVPQSNGFYADMIVYPTALNSEFRSHSDSGRIRAGSGIGFCRVQCTYKSARCSVRGILLYES